MRSPDLDRDQAASARWTTSFLLGIAATGGAAALLGGAAGLIVGAAALAATLSGELLGLVQRRSRGLRLEIVDRLTTAQAEHADAAVAARSHDPFAHVRRLLHDHRDRDPSVAEILERLEGTLRRVDGLVARTGGERHRWEIDGPPDLIGGLAGASELGQGLKLYGDPAIVPGRLRGRRAGAWLLRVGRVLDDVRLLHSADIEWAVLTFTLWARAILLVLAPSLGALSFAPAPSLDAGPVRLAAWVLALVWAVATALLAPRVATLAMSGSPAGRRTRRALLLVEAPLAVALALAWPGWPAVAFGAGWTNWWQRLGRTSATPDFSWGRLAVWIATTLGAQAVGLLLARPGAPAWEIAAEAGIALVVMAIIGASYGAMLPASAGIVARVLLMGARHRRLAGTDAQRLIDDIAAAMTRAADELAALPEDASVDAEAEGVLRRAVDAMLPVAGPRKPEGPAPLAAIVTAALAEGGHDMWIDDPRALAAQARAERAGQILPVVVTSPEFDSDDLRAIMIGEDVAQTLHRLLVACIVEARVHGTRRVHTLLTRQGDLIEVRVANQPRPGGSRGGRGHGLGRIRQLAARLPGAAEVERGITDRSFIGGRPNGELFGVRFVFSAGHPSPDPSSEDLRS